MASFNFSAEVATRASGCLQTLRGSKHKSRCGVDIPLLQDLSTYELLEILDSDGWELVALELGKGAAAIQKEGPYTRGGAKRFFHRQSLTMINRSFLTASRHANPIFNDGHVEAILHRQAAAYYIYLVK